MRVGEGQYLAAGVLSTDDLALCTRSLSCERFGSPTEPCTLTVPDCGRHRCWPSGNSNAAAQRLGLSSYSTVVRPWIDGRKLAGFCTHSGE